mgnify:CR=1 FL=1
MRPIHQKLMFLSPIEGCRDTIYRVRRGISVATHGEAVTSGGGGVSDGGGNGVSDAGGIGVKVGITGKSVLVGKGVTVGNGVSVGAVVDVGIKTGGGVFVRTMMGGGIN